MQVIQKKPNNRTLIEEPSFVKLIVDKNHLTLKIQSRTPNGDLFILTKSPPDLLANSEIRTKENGKEIKPLKQYDYAIIVFDNELEANHIANKKISFS